MSSEDVREGSGDATGAPALTEVVLTDPKMMRALAHPVRMALIELIEVAGTLTATQASELLGESPANCAFHLRTLAKYGYIAEAGGGKGRERPWKRVDLRIQLSTDHEDSGTNLTARTLQQLWLDRVLARMRRELTSSENLTKEWREAKQATQDLAFLTPDELREFNAQVLELADRFRDRKSDAASRPEGALPVELLFFGYPLTDLAELAAVTSSADEAPFTDEADDQ